MELAIYRHGATPGNEAHLYVGSTDEPLSAQGRKQAVWAGVFEDVALVYASPMRRAIESAQLRFPRARIHVVEGLQEFDFGVFEGRSAEQMQDDEQYCAWVASGCLDRCPEGECRASFTDRVCAALQDLLLGARERGEQEVVVLAHGGTIMAAFSRLSDDPRDYFDWLVPNNHCARAQVRFGPDGSIALEPFDVPEAHM